MIATVCTKEQVQRVIQNALPMVVSGYVLDTEKKRRSILWRMAETVAKFGICQESILQHVARILRSCEAANEIWFLQWFT